MNAAWMQQQTVLTCSIINNRIAKEVKHWYLSTKWVYSEYSIFYVCEQSSLTYNGVWQQFALTDHKTNAQCKTCEKQLTYSGGTTNLSNYLKYVRTWQLPKAGLGKAKICFPYRAVSTDTQIYVLLCLNDTFCHPQRKMSLIGSTSEYSNTHSGKNQCILEGFKSLGRP